MSDLLERVNLDLIEATFLGPEARCEHGHGNFLRCPDPCLGAASHKVLVGCQVLAGCLWCLAVVQWHDQYRQDGRCAGCGRLSHECWTVIAV